MAKRIGFGDYQYEVVENWPKVAIRGAVADVLRRAAPVLRAHAVLEQRPAVDPDDLQILKHGFWNTHEQRATIAQLVAALANPINASAFELADQAQSVYEAVMAAQRSGDPNLSSSKVVIEGNDKLREIRKRLRQLLDQAKAEGRKTDRILKIGQKVREMNEAVAALILGAPSEEAF